MGCCSGIIRILLFIFNFVFWLIGLALLGIGIWLLVDNKSKAIASVLPFYGIAVYIIIAAGAITTVVGFLGCCGACKESKCLLIIFSVFLGIIFAVEVAAGIIAIVQRSSLSNLVTDTFNDILPASGHLDDLATNNLGLFKGIEAMQESLECCGLNATTNWQDPATAKGCLGTTTTIATTLASGTTTAAATTTSGVMVPTTPSVCASCYPPCENKIQEFIENSFLIVGISALVFSVVQIIGICFSCIVIKNADNDVGPV